MTEVSNTPREQLTVDGLIERLKNYHGSTPVLVDGYESGFDEIGFRLFRVKHDPGGWWAGAYDEDEDSGIEALVLQRIKP